MDTPDRVRAARERLGISHEEMADQLGLSVASYWDLESYESEIWSCLTLEELARLSEIIGLSCRRILGVPPNSTVPRRPDELRRLILEYCSQNEVSPADYSDQTGWELAGFMADPDTAFKGWSIDALRDICEPLGVDFLEFLPS